MSRRMKPRPTPAGPGAVYIDWITAAIMDGRATQRGIAKHLALSPSAINRMLKGDRKLKAEEIPVIALLIGKPPDVPGRAA